MITTTGKRLPKQRQRNAFVSRVGEIYVLSTTFSYATFEWEHYSRILDGETFEQRPFPLSVDTFSADGAPSGIFLNPENGDIYISDSGNYVSTAFLYHYTNTGVFVEKLNAGVRPGHLAWDVR